MKRRIKEHAKLVYKKAMFNLSANWSPVYTSYYKYFYTPKPGSMAEFIDYFSKRNRHLKVIQIGANDGYNHDPIHRFIRRDKWQGVLLEPQPYVYEKQLKKLHRHTKGIHTINAALDSRNGSRTLYKLAVSNARWASGLSSFNRESLEKVIDSGRAASKLRDEGKPVPDKREDYISEIAVPCINPATLMEKYGIRKIDFLQIDTEGFDYEVIKMFNIPETKPKVIVFESHNLSEEDKAECTAFLKKQGYWLKQFAGDSLAMHEPEQEYQHFFR